MSVLIITKSDDNECVTAVIRGIENRGGKAVRLDTDLFPTDTRLVVRYEPGGDQLHLATPDDEVDLREISAVWYRRTRFGGAIPATLDEQLRRASVGESRVTILGMIASLDAFHLDPVTTIRHSSNKQLQLKVARDVGLETPRTLITNDPEAVRRFAARCPGGVVAKMLSSFAVFDEQGDERVVFTNPVSEADLADLEGLRLCPMTFQERIAKRCELRVIVVGRQVFSAYIDSGMSSRAVHDWRRDGQGLLEHWRPYPLPAAVAERLLLLMDRFDLNYGAADLIVTPDERHVFLEVNPVGEFLWLERYPGLPVAQALADTLLGRVPRRDHAHIRSMA
ncbi:MAG: MvdD family ATP-grasp ribosomal peptide maturase [Planctomycetes bacterium]|nr:MvdD family ATP-grasp ribosomal peptide maturase [Planctomycetota bacterium]